MNVNEHEKEVSPTIERHLCQWLPPLPMVFVYSSPRSQKISSLKHIITRTFQEKCGLSFSKERGEPGTLNKLSFRLESL